MTQSPARATPLPLPDGAPLVRLLAALDDAPLPAVHGDSAERLAGWTEWREAIVLANVLNAPDDETIGDPPDHAKLVQDAKRLRLRLEALTRDPVAPTRSSRPPRSTAPEPVDPTPVDFASLRQGYVAAQREMAARIAELRQSLRAALAAESPELARLAALDAVMDRVVGAREQLLLDGVPRWLAPRFTKRELPDFTRDLQTVLRAELALRWQPVEALLDALIP